MPEGIAQAAMGVGFLLLAYFLMRRSSKTHHARMQSNSHVDAKRELTKLENDYRNEVTRLQVKLHDFEREIDAKIQSRVTQLEQLLEVTDQEISRFQNSSPELRSEKSQNATINSPHIIKLMRDSGFTEEEAQKMARKSAS